MSIHEGGSSAPKHFYGAVVFFLFVVIVTLVIFGYKQKVTAENNSLQQNISESQRTLSQLRKDKDVQAYELYDKNRNQLDILTYNSQIPLFYNEIARLGRLYNFEFSNFSFNKGNIKVSALAKSSTTEESYKKFRDLIADFYDSRLNVVTNDDDEASEKVLDSIVDLQFVRSFQGSNNISSLLEFIIKPELKEPEPKVEKQVEKTQEQETPATPDDSKSENDTEKVQNALKQAASN